MSDEDRPGRYDERYDVRQEDVERKLYSIGRMIGEDMPEGWGFLLMIASYGEGGMTFYLSSMERAGAIKMLEEFLAREKAKATGQT
jgi:hypothetical protein